MKNLLNKNKTQKITTLVQAIKNCFAGRGLPTPFIDTLRYNMFMHEPD
jgi:hypothetical protein